MSQPYPDLCVKSYGEFIPSSKATFDQFVTHNIGIFYQACPGTACLDDILKILSTPYGLVNLYNYFTNNLQSAIPYFISIIQFCSSHVNIKNIIAHIHDNVIPNYHKTLPPYNPLSMTNSPPLVNIQADFLSLFGIKMSEYYNVQYNPEWTVGRCIQRLYKATNQTFESQTLKQSLLAHINGWGICNMMQFLVKWDKNNTGVLQIRKIPIRYSRDVVSALNVYQYGDNGPAQIRDGINQQRHNNFMLAWQGYWIANFPVQFKTEPYDSLLQTEKYDSFYNLRTTGHIVAYDKLGVIDPDIAYDFLGMYACFTSPQQTGGQYYTSVHSHMTIAKLLGDHLQLYNQLLTSFGMNEVYELPSYNSNIGSNTLHLQSILDILIIIKQVLRIDLPTLKQRIQQLGQSGTLTCMLIAIEFLETWEMVERNKFDFYKIKNCVSIPVSYYDSPKPQVIHQTPSIPTPKPTQDAKVEEIQKPVQSKITKDALMTVQNDPIMNEIYKLIELKVRLSEIQSEYQTKFESMKADGNNVKIQTNLEMLNNLSGRVQQKIIATAEDIKICLDQSETLFANKTKGMEREIKESTGQKPQSQFDYDQIIKQMQILRDLKPNESVIISFI